MNYSEARGTLIHEKNLKSKISCQTPFDLVAKETLKVVFNVFSRLCDAVDTGTERKTERRLVRVSEKLYTF